MAAAASAAAAAAGSSSSELPAFLAARVALWDRLRGSQPHVEERPIKVSLPDGKVVEAVAGKTTPFDVAASIAKSLAAKTLAAVVDGVSWDAWRPLEKDCDLKLVTFDSPEGKHVFWHSSAHILGQALELAFGAHLCIGPPVKEGEGFYYDCFMEERRFTEKDYETVNELIKKIVAEKQPFERLVISKDDALEMFRYNKFKEEIISAIDAPTVTVYRCGPLIDLCRGPHVVNTGVIKAMQVTKNSAAYWRASADNASLQRVYGVSFPDAKQLKEYIRLQEEAKLRDHRVIGKNQELFFFHERSPGSAFFLPHGTRIYNRLVQLMRDEYWKRGYTEVVSPNVFNLALWETSGHVPLYRKNMFEFTVEEQAFGMKPMNCPGHCLIFGSKARSYRELPIRMAEFGVLHRNEFSGALSGLTRVRRFVQDDAHIFCRSDQVESEITSCLEFLRSIYGIFGFQFELELSTRPADFLGTVAQWDQAEAQLKGALDAFGQKWTINAGDGAFYGPKIDIGVFDALKRRFQCATIQLDFQLPQRFKLEYEDGHAHAADEEPARPVMVHRAILGSVERMIAILCEHFGGKWPLWLSPRQVCVVPVAPEYFAYAQSVAKDFHDAGFYADADVSDNQLKKKIRDAQIAQYNFILVVGEKEAKDGSVNVRTRDNVVHGEKDVKAAVQELVDLRAKFQ